MVAKHAVPFQGDQRFESPSLQRGVSSELHGIFAAEQARSGRYTEAVIRPEAAG